MTTRKKVLVLGVTEMLNHTIFRSFSARQDIEVFGAVRNTAQLPGWLAELGKNRISFGIDADNYETLLRLLDIVRPEVVINCIGVIKQLLAAQDPLTIININALFPHRLALACRLVNAWVIQISTDCVFSGKKGQYTEEEDSDATDLYGRTKYLGELNYSHCVTLRTSIIGHELRGRKSLVDWFLGETDRVRGYARAIYSGLPTVELARVIAEFVLPNSGLSGLYHVSSRPISKCELLGMVSRVYGKGISIQRDEDFTIDRSLNSGRFLRETGYESPSWEALVQRMHNDFLEVQRLMICQAGVGAK